MVVLLMIFAALTVVGWHAQRSVGEHPPRATTSPHLVALQIQAIIFEWATLVWVWLGVRRKGLRVRELIGGRCPNIRSVLVDILLAGGLWLVWTGITGVVNLWLGRFVDIIPYASNPLEVLLAIVVAISAGICEEIVFRGYLQRQFWALSGSAAAAVLLQAAVFGMPHVYQGRRIAMMASFYGILLGVLALWRGSLRPGICTHAWSDIAARLLRI